jgi:hypothetical protein
VANDVHAREPRGVGRQTASIRRRVESEHPSVGGRRLELGRQQSLEAIPVELAQEIQHLCATHMVGRRWNAARPYGAVGAQMIVEAQALVQRGALP